jgi:hypothetical protein
MVLRALHVSAMGMPQKEVFDELKCNLPVMFRKGGFANNLGRALLDGFSKATTDNIAVKDNVTYQQEPRLRRQKIESPGGRK